MGRRLFGPEPKTDIDAELAFHIEMRTRELTDEGVRPNTRERSPKPLW